MNKLIIDKVKEITLDNDKYLLDIKVNKLTLIIRGNVIVNDTTNNDDLDLTIKLLDDSKLIYNRYNENISDYKLSVIQNNNSDILYNHSLMESIPCNILCNIKLLGNNNKTSINIYGVVEDEGCIRAHATGDITKNIKDNEFLENIRILMLNDKENIIIPDLLVSSNEVIVNHNATISSVNEDYLFYLCSKGLSVNAATKLIVEGFLFKNLKELGGEECE